MTEIKELAKILDESGGSEKDLKDLARIIANKFYQDSSPEIKDWITVHGFRDLNLHYDPRELIGKILNSLSMEVEVDLAEFFVWEEFVSSLKSLFYEEESKGGGSMGEVKAEVHRWIQRCIRAANDLEDSTSKDTQSIHALTEILFNCSQSLKDKVNILNFIENQ